MGCLKVTISDACSHIGASANGVVASHLKVTTSIVCSVSTTVTLIGLLDSMGRRLFDSEGRRLTVRR